MSAVEIRPLGPPARDEVAPYYLHYIDLVPGGDVLGVLEAQLEPTVTFLATLTEERSLHRYAADKWSIRGVLSHVNDGERLFLFRAFWFARGFDSELPSFDEKFAAVAAKADAVPWARLVEEFRAARLGTLAFFRNLPAEAWLRKGIASGNPFTVRSLAYIAAGHVIHHLGVLREKYV